MGAYRSPSKPPVQFFGSTIEIGFEFVSFRGLTLGTAEGRAKLEEILAQHTKQPLDKIKKDSDRDYFMSAEEAKAYGVVDEVIKSVPKKSK